MVAINKGEGRFTIEKLPSITQLSSINAFHCLDANGDGFIDIVLGGNRFDFQPQLGRVDAATGDLLLNDGKGKLQVVDAAKCGLDHYMLSCRRGTAFAGLD